MLRYTQNITAFLLRTTTRLQPLDAWWPCDWMIVNSVERMSVDLSCCNFDNFRHLTHTTITSSTQHAQ